MFVPYPLPELICKFILSLEELIPLVLVQTNRCGCRRPTLQISP